MMHRILIVDDHEVVRQGLKSMFTEHWPDAVFGEAGTPPEAVRIVADQAWDIVILDLSLGARSGLEVLQQIRDIKPRLPVVILSMHSEEQYARRAYKAGAAGYLTKDSPRSELVHAVEKVIAGGRYVSPELAEKLVSDLGRVSDRPPHESLSNREYQILCLIASGKTVREIAELLSLSDKTISTYRARILEKMGLRTSAELTYYAIQNGLVK